MASQMQTRCALWLCGHAFAVAASRPTPAACYYCGAASHYVASCEFKSICTQFKQLQAEPSRLRTIDPGPPSTRLDN